MTKDPLLFALTGSIGSGKSTAARFFAEEGFVIIDADEISHQITRSPNVLQEIANLFDASLVLPDGSLDRKKLAAQVFADVEKRKELEDLLHPKIREEFFLQLKSIRAKNPKQPVLHVVPITMPLSLLLQRRKQREFNGL
jgi:dephospho-CoA kinase